MNAQRYLVIVERAGGNYSAYSPDLPGCIATGDTVEETVATMREAMSGHLALMREQGLPIPEPSSTAEYVAV